MPSVPRMRTPALAVVLVAASAALVAAAGGSPLRVQVDKSKVDLKAHHLEVKLSHPAAKVKITVYSDSDAVLAEEEQDFTGRGAGAPLIVTWTPSSDAAVGRIDLRAYDVQNRWVAVEISPWSVTLNHEDVNFATDSAEIPDKDVPKLEAAFAKMSEVLAEDKAKGRQHPGITFFVAGHT